MVYISTLFYYRVAHAAEDLLEIAEVDFLGTTSDCIKECFCSKHKQRQSIDIPKKVTRKANPQTVMNVFPLLA